MGLTARSARLLRPTAACSTAAALLCGCGTAAAPAVDAPPPEIQLSALLSARAVAVSPAVVGAGPASLLITNQARRSLRVAVACNGRRAGAAPEIAPGSATELSVELKRGRCTVGAFALRTTQARAFLPSPLAAATIRVGRARPPRNASLLEP